MNQSLPELILATRVALAESVRPEITSDHANAQLAGVLDILAKLERMVVWSPVALREQAALLDAGCSAFSARLASEGMRAPASSAVAPTEEVPSDGAAMAAEARLKGLTDWLFDPSLDIAAALRVDLERILQQAMRQALIVERKLIPPTDFSAMTSAAAVTP